MHFRHRWHYESSSTRVCPVCGKMQIFLNVTGWLNEADFKNWQEWIRVGKRNDELRRADKANLEAYLKTIRS